jgi:hypothetical protein
VKVCTGNRQQAPLLALPFDRAVTESLRWGIELTSNRKRSSSSRTRSTSLG